MTYNQAVEQCRERDGQREISDEAARVLCAGWQSSGTVGWALAAVASGRWDRETLQHNLAAFHDDLYATFSHYSAGSVQRLVWDMLATWSINGGDNTDGR